MSSQMGGAHRSFGRNAAGRRILFLHSRIVLGAKPFDGLRIKRQAEMKTATISNSQSAIQGEQMKMKRILGIMMLTACMSAVPATLAAQDQMKQDDMKLDDMK